MSFSIELLEQSFERIKPQSEAFTISFYNNLFLDYPEVRPLFKNSDMSQQRQKLFKSLVLVIENIRNPQKLKDVLQQLGQQHINYGVRSSHYSLVGNSLLKTFAFYLGKDWTPEVKQAWIEAYQTISSFMLEESDSSEITGS